MYELAHPLDLLPFMNKNGICEEPRVIDVDGTSVSIKYVANNKSYAFTIDPHLL